MATKNTPWVGYDMTRVRSFLLQAANHRGDACLEWPYARGQNGYGHVQFEGRLTTAHRAVLTLHRGEPPSPEMEAAHAPLICHNPGCVNPKHLRWATHAENMADAAIDARGTDDADQAQGRA